VNLNDVDIRVVDQRIGGADGLHFPTHFLPHPEEPK
jgi:hypothetical protein